MAGARGGGGGTGGTKLQLFGLDHFDQADYSTN